MKSIASRIILLIAGAAVAPLLIYGAGSISSLRRGTEQSVTAGNLSVALQISERITQYFDNTRRMLNSVAAQIHGTQLASWQKERILRNHVLDFPGADPVVPLFGFVFLVALGIDYNIFLMTRVREESARVGTREGTLRALTVTGGVITSAGVVLAATFSALAVIPLLFLGQIAFIVAPPSPSRIARPSPSCPAHTPNWWPL